jgi:hypothetical protein
VTRVIDRTERIRLFRVIDCRSTVFNHGLGAGRKRFEAAMDACQIYILRVAVHDNPSRSTVVHHAARLTKLSQWKELIFYSGDTYTHN